jgi:hypothetical protein
VAIQSITSGSEWAATLINSLPQELYMTISNGMWRGIGVAGLNEGVILYYFDLSFADFECDHYIMVFG